jgi:hypothetical protein
MKAKLQWRLTPVLSALSAAAGTKRLLVVATSALFALPALAQSDIDYCAKARDPVRCEARQAALKNCAEKRGRERRACLDSSIPPVDCSKAQNPQHCEAAQKAKEICKGKSGKTLRKCLRDEQPKKKMAGKRPSST